MDEQQKQEKLSEIRELARQGRIRFPSQEKVKEAGPYIREILDAIGVKGAYVSDLSTLGDFDALWDDTDEAMKEIANNLGLDKVTTKDYLWEVALRLRERDNGRGV